MMARAQPFKVAALVISYFPDAEFADRLNKLRQQVSRVVVVDNGSERSSLEPLQTFREDPGFTLCHNTQNFGIATALNQGMELLATEGYDWVLTFDQDSSVRSGFVMAIFDTLAADPAPHEVALIGANREDHGISRPHRWVRPKRVPPFFERVPCDQLCTEGTTIVITSGTLTRVAVFQAIGQFRDDFFIDLVDMEYCLRARKAGFRTIVSCKARLGHQVGEKRNISFLGFTIAPTNHSPLRRYYLFRNSVLTVQAYGTVFPHWLIYHALALTEVFAGIILAEGQKWKKLRACVAGLWDGFRGRSGPCRQTF